MMQGASPRRSVPGLLLLAAAAVAMAWGGGARALSEQRRFSDFAIDNWTVADGLPQVAVQTLAQDGDGYLWVGTQSSIARFDGVRFEVFDRRRTGGIDTAMSEVGVGARDGHAWFALPQGAIRLRRDEARLFSAAGTPVAVQAIAEWPAGQMNFGTPRGLYRLDGAALVPAGLDGTDVGALLGAGPVLWIGTRGRLLRREGNQTRGIDLPGGADLRITHLLEAGGRLWIGTPRGLWVMDGDGTPAPYAGAEALGRLPIEALCVDGGGSVWISTAPRLFRLRASGTLDAVEDGQFVRNPWVNACLQDREGNLWLGSQTESLFRAWDGRITRIGERDGLVDPFVWALEKDGDGAVLIGTNSGLSRWSAGRIETLVDGAALPNAAVYELARLPDGRTWIGTRAGLRELEGGRLRVPEGAGLLEQAQVNAIVVDGDAVWVGASNGLFRSVGGQALASVTNGALDGPGKRVRAVLPMGPARALIGTEDGVLEVDGAEVGVPAWAHFLRGRMVTQLLRLPGGAIAVGTLDAGLAVVAGGRAVALDAPGVLPTSNAFTLTLSDGNLFVSSTEGLYRLPLSALPDPAAGATNPTAPLPASWVVSMTGRNQSGQRARCCNGGARSRALLVGDELWLPSISGVLRVELDAIGSGPVVPLVHVEGAVVDGRRHGAFDGRLSLGGERRDVRFDYTALNFRSPQSMRFEYRLDGFDNTWIDAGERRSAFYTNLPPGEFRFRVRARDEFGSTVQAGNTLGVVVVPRWSERPLVRALLAAAGLLLVALAVIVALRRQRRRTARLENLVDERTRQLQRANERLEQANAVLAVESQTDALTGLPNRRAVFQQMPAMLASHPDGVVLALVDIDHFKAVNDDYGHATGDIVLRDFAAFLRRATREGDLLARWGGEEFLVVFGGLREQAVPARIQRLIDDGRAMHYDLGNERPLHLTFSIGWTQHPLGAVAPNDWVAALELADAALYQAKAHGRDTWVGLAAGPQAGGRELHGHPGKCIDELVGEGRLHWLNLKPKLAAVGGRARAG